VANEIARSHLRHPLGDLYPMGCAIPTVSHVDDLRSKDDTGPCHLMVMWGQALLATATAWVASTRRFGQFKTNVLMSLVRVFLDGICLMSDELWVARSFVKPVVQLMAACTQPSNKGSEEGSKNTEEGSEEGNKEEDFIETMSVVVGRLTYTLVRGNPVSDTERNLRGWTKSTLFNGGLVEGVLGERKKKDEMEEKEGQEDTTANVSFPPLQWKENSGGESEGGTNRSPRSNAPRHVGCDLLMGTINDGKDDYSAWKELCVFMKEHTHDVSVKGRIKLSFYKIDRTLKKHVLSNNVVDRLYFCALVRHGSPQLWKEVQQLVVALRKKKEEGGEEEGEEHAVLSADLNCAWLEVLRMRRHISVAMKGMYKSMMGSANNTKKEKEGEEGVEGEEGEEEGEEEEEDHTFALPPARALTNGQRTAPTRKDATTLRQASDGFRRRQLNLRRRRQPRLIKVCA